MELSTPDKPEVLRMARILGIDKDAVLGKLFRVWAWFDKNTVDGHVDGVVSTDVDGVVLQVGFTSAMQQVGWFEFDDDAQWVRLVNFDRHNGETAKNRALKNKRQSKWRANVDGNVDAKPSTDASTREEKRREEKKKEIKNTITSEQFDVFWKLWPATDRRTNKAKCLAKWKADRLDDNAAEILSHVTALKQTQKWRDGYEPAPLTYLNGMQWQDDLPTVQRQPAQQPAQSGRNAERARVAAQIFGTTTYTTNEELDITGFAERVE